MTAFFVFIFPLNALFEYRKNKGAFFLNGEAFFLNEKVFNGSSQFQMTGNSDLDFALFLFAEAANNLDKIRQNLTEEKNISMGVRPNQSEVYQTPKVSFLKKNHRATKTFKLDEYEYLKKKILDMEMLLKTAQSKFKTQHFKLGQNLTNRYLMLIMEIKKELL